ncbi:MULTISPECIES: GAF domain-containing protein [unclassified Rhodococcus (in: high G+C Gram-positive bacteria)]|uniref:GAF domain-containing protein n=1 Tax=unclassified Rhodococcus (in: high G+C Gram-positive bacteria) TaxID=192944 RepID=UPI000AAB6529|nr:MULTISPECIES: GAF domain-containing protein [unclassified Rhodococcus (in: high G+C Gram-positive bacteria)]
MARQATGAAPDAHDGWIVVETLAEPPDGDAGPVGTVVAKDGRAKDWTALSRAVGSKRIADAARAMTAFVAASGEDAAETVPGLNSPLRAVAVPGPRKAVHGVMLYAGDDSDAPPPLVVGYDWSSSRRQFAFTPGIAGVTGREPASKLAAPAFELFDHADDADSAMYLLVALLDAEPGTRWDGTVALRTPRGARPLRNAVRTVLDTSSADDASRYVDTVSHALAISLRADELVVAGPSVEAFALRSLTRNSPTAIALIDTERVRVVRWLTDPVENILWKGQVDQRDTPHPSDIARIVSAYRQMHEWADHRTEIPGVRLRRVDGGWTVVDLRATRVPGQRFLMVEFQPVGFSDEDDPVPPTDTGYPGRGPRRRSS